MQKNKKNISIHNRIKKNKIFRNKINQRVQTYIENYKTLLREFKDINKSKGFHEFEELILK